jgi:Putative beta barrel porin-7 (BBP7)
MAKAWMSPALLTVVLTVAPAAGQEPYMPGQGNSDATANALPCLGSPTGGLPSGGMDQFSANSLPSDLPNAWDMPKPKPACPDPPVLYGSLGYMGLLRQRLGHGAAAVIDNASGGVDTGNPPPPGAPLGPDFHDIHMRFNNGERVTLGFHCDGQAFELSGFYLSQNSSAKMFANPGSLDSFFNVGGNFNAAPLGFEGDNGLWLQADVMRLRLQTAMGSAEANYRCWPSADSSFSWLVGVRYLDLYERFSFYTGDDDLTVLGTNGLPDPTKQATYSVTAHNQIVAPQLGFEWNRPINCWLAFTMSAKGAWGANFLTVDVNLKRGDGFQGPHNGRSQTLFSQLYETGFFLDFCLCEKARLRAGYDLMWVADVAEALGQFDYDLSHTSGRTKNNQTIFYQGPVVELHFLF